MKKKPTKKKPELKQKCDRDVPQVALTLLDWFAGQALQGYLSNQCLVNAACDAGNEANVSAPYIVADACYGHAKAMMKVREHERA